MSNYGSYQPFNMIDGLGVRCSIYFSGCPLKCKGCYNKAIQDKNYGFEFTQDNVDQILDDCSKSYVSGLSILGGEPMENTESVLDLIKQFRAKFGDDKDIWMWSGYTFEEIKHIDEEGMEFWYARELAKVLEYTEWRNFYKVIERAMKACANSENSINDHLLSSTKW